MKKNILNLMTLRTAMMLATVIVTFLALPTKALADSSGYCGDPSVNDGQGVSWDFDGNTLAISGSGAMADYANTDDIPWKDYIYLISEVTIGNEITHIGSYAFVFCDKLTSITIPASVTSIGVGTFISCNKLQTVTFGAGSLLKTIGKEAFQSTKFESIMIPSNVESIGDEAFSESKLTSVTIPASVTSIGIKVFDDCKSLSEIKVDEGNEYYKSVEGVLMNKEGTLLIAYPIGNAASSYTIPDNVKTIDINAFYSATNLTSVTIPASVTNIGKLAFGFSGLTSVDISAGVTSIGEYAFQNCESLSSVTIPASVESIDNSAFTGCSSLSTVYLMPTNPPTLGPYAFKDIPDASVFYVRNADYKTATGWSDYSTKMKVMSTVTIGDDLLVTDPDINEGGSYYVEGKEVGVKNAEGSTFNYNTFIVKTASGEAIPVTGPDDEGIYTFTMPAEDVTVTGAWTSGNCTCTLDAEGNFTVTANDPTNGSAMADYNDDDDRPWNTKANDIKTVTVGSGVTSIGKYSFSGCDNLTSATIAASVKNISDKAFVKSGLKAIHFADDSQLEFIGGLSFCKCPMQEITIPASVQTIDAGAFNDCASLQAIHFESGSQLKSIVHNAFEGCNNTSLTSITIPTSVNNIYTLAFGNCTYLETIYVLPSEIPVLGTTAFEGCAANLKFYVHGAAYKTATNWSDYSTKMTVIGTITLATDITATATPTFSYDGTDYYAEGTEVTLAYSGSDELKSFIVKDAEGNSIDVKETNGTFSFQMPASDVTVTSQIKKTTVTVTLPVGLSTYYHDKGLRVSDSNADGVKMYAVTAVSDDQVTLKEISNRTIPAYTPVIISNSGTGALACTFEEAATDARESEFGQMFATDLGTATTAKEFIGTAEALSAYVPDNSATVYGFNGAAFVKMEGTLNIAANRCWIEIGGMTAGGARELNIVLDGETTGIHSVDNGQWIMDNGADTWYTIDGRKLSGKPTKKGIYIKNGKKHVIK